MTNIKYEDRHRELAQYARDYDERFQARDWQTIEAWPAERDPNKLTDLQERTNPIVLEVIAEAREVVSRFSGYAEGKYVKPLEEKLAELDKETSK